MGAAQLMGSAGTPVATGLARGIGTGPQVIFPSNNTPVALGSGFSNPAGVAVDGIGDVFVADTYNNAVKKMVAVNGGIPASPTILTLGSGFSNPVGVAVDGSGNVFVADDGNSAVKEMVAVNGSIPASPTILILGNGFNFPEGVAVDASDNVFVADYGNNAVKEMVAVNGSIPASPTILTLGSGFTNPFGVAVDGSGNVFVADTVNSAVKEMVAVNGIIPATPTILRLGSGFSYPDGVTVDASGDIFVVDTFNSAVKELPYATAPSLSFVSTPVGSTSSDSTQTVTVANDGNADLSFTVPATGLNPSLSNNNFTFGNSSTCLQLDTSSSPATLAPGASCTDLISFSPTAIGSIAGSLAITDNNLNATSATQTINLSGTATVSTQTITFPQPATPVTYGVAPVTLAATASSGLAVSYTVTGPATISGSTLTFTGTGTVLVTATQVGDTNYSAATPVLDTILVNPGTLRVTAANATRVVGAANPVFTGTYTGAVNGDTFTVSATSTATVSSPVGTYPITPTVAGTNLADYAVTNVNGTLTVTAASTTTALTSSASAITAGQSVTFTATVKAGAIPVTIGTVTFLNGTTSIGTATVNSSGVATLTIATLAAGGDPAFTASYGATPDYAASISPTVMVMVATAIPSSFTIVAAPASLTIQQGQTGKAALQLLPVGGYSGTVTFRCSNLPANAVCTFVQNSVQLTGNNQPVNVELTIYTSLQQARFESIPKPTQSPVSPILPALAFWWPGSLAGLTGFRRKRKLSKSRWMHLCLLLLASGALAVGLAGCGGAGFGPYVTPAGTSTVTVTATATSGTNVTTQTAALSLTIAQ